MRKLISSHHKEAIVEPIEVGRRVEAQRVQEQRSQRSVTCQQTHHYRHWDDQRLISIGLSHSTPACAIDGAEAVADELPHIGCGHQQ